MKKTFYTILWCAFAVYLLALVWLLFLNRPVGFSMSISEYFKKTANIVPLRTIIRYVTAYGYGYAKLSVTNLLGNFLLFLPMGALLPCLFKRVNKFYKVVIIVAATVLLVEILQGLLRVGTPDIDDFILNLSGAMLGYAIWNIPFINKTIKKISE